MYLNRLLIHKFRNLQNTTLTCSPHQNYLFGDNAQGKTNFIEAIYLLCLAKSFRSREENDLVPLNDSEYFVEGEFISDSSLQHRVAVYYEPAKGKQIHVDGKRLNQYSKLIGLFPIISLSAEDYSITAGPPAQRRRFFNILLSQSSNRYLDDLKHYEKVLKQRNLLLGELAYRKSLSGQLDVWTTQLVEYGERLINARLNMVDALNQFLGDYYSTITHQPSTLKVRYRPNVHLTASKSIQEQFEAQLHKVQNKEQQQKRTLVGPHRDEFVFFVGDNELRRFGSQGEHKSALVSLKAAEARVLYKRLEVHPILLLDDLYAELDKSRSAHVIDLFDAKNQIFVTGTTLDYLGFQQTNQFTENQFTFMVNNGSIERQNHVASS